MAQPSGQLVKKSDQRVTVRGWFEAQKGEIGRAVPKHIDPERLVRVALTACVQNPALLNCTRESLMQATLQSASLGLMPDGIMGQAYLLPYGDKAQFQIGYQGLLELIYRTDRISGVVADIVHEKDKFEYRREVEKDFFVHVPSDEDDPGPATHAYAIIRRKDGTANVTVLSKSKIEREHRSHSRAKSNGPWVNHWEAMARKTALLVAMKYEQKSSELAKAIAVEERVDQGIDIPAVDAEVLDVEAKAEPQQSALDKLAGVAPSSSNAPECAGCAKNTPTPDVTDDEGRAWHKLCLDAVKKDQSRKG
jgi:recombination protein RecT